MPTLRCQPFEHYMLVDSHRDIEMGDCYRFTFSGQIDRDRFTSAYYKALYLHPLLRALLVGERLWRTAKLSWQVIDAEQCYLHWADAETPMLPPHGCSRMIDIQREPGIRTYVRCNPDGEQTRVLCQIHHACADAAGVFSFWNDLILFYNGVLTQTIQDEARLIKLTEARLMVQPGVKALLVRKFFTWARHLKFFTFRPQEIKAVKKWQHGGQEHPRPDKDEKDLSWPPAVSVTLSKDQLATVKKRAQSLQVTLNDYLLTALYFTIYRYSKTTTNNAALNRIRISVAFNMRTKEAQQTTACNVVSMCYLDRNIKKYGDFDSLARSVATETSHLKAKRLGTAMLDILRFAGRFPKGMVFLCRPPLFRCLATTAMSNLGRAFVNAECADSEGVVKLGEVPLSLVEAMPSGRSYLPVALTVSTYAGHLTMTLSYNQTSISRKDAHIFIEAFRSEALGVKRRATSD